MVSEGEEIIEVEKDCFREDDSDLDFVSVGRNRSQST